MSDDLVDSILRCGLYFGAIFQVICIAAAVVVPDKMNDFTASYKDGVEGGGSEDEASDRSSPHATPRRPPHAHHRQRKQEKKKRR